MDSFKFRGRRKRLIEQLRAQERYDERVLQAMAQLPRHAFIPSAFSEHAYDDKPWPIACEQTISQPSTVAWQSTALELLPRQRVLEVGTGSGYQAAVLALLGGRVFSVERHETLWRQARLRLRRLRIRGVRCFLRDGSEGLPEFAPYARILVTAAANEIPQELVQQLDVGGLMVIPIGPSGQVQRLLRLRKTAPDAYETEDLGGCAFVPFLKGIEDDK